MLPLSGSIHEPFKHGAVHVKAACRRRISISRERSPDIVCRVGYLFYQTPIKQGQWPFQTLSLQIEVRAL